MNPKNKYDIRYLDKKETYSLMLSAIYASEADPKYKLLSDLMYCLDEKTFKTFLTLFEGQTITIPTLQQMSEMLKALTIYTYRDIYQMSWKEIRKLLKINDPAFEGTRPYKLLKQNIADRKINVGGMFDAISPKSSN